MRTTRPGSTAPYVRIVEAVSTSACAGATVIAATGGQPRKVRCNKFTAELVDSVRVSSTLDDLTPTGETVEVQHKFQSPMVIGASLTLALRSDGIWTILVWECG